MNPVFASTNHSFLGIESRSTVPLGNPKMYGFESNVFISAYAHATLESELGFDILAFVDGDLANMTEQPVTVKNGEGRQWEAVALLAKRSDAGTIVFGDDAEEVWNSPKRSRYVMYVVLPEDVEATRPSLERAAKF